MKERLKRISSSALALAALFGWLAPKAWAHQPQVVLTGIVGATEGSVVAGNQLAGDHFFRVEILADRNFAENFVLVVIDGDNPREVAGKPVLNLEEFLAEEGASPRFNEKWQDPGPALRMYTANRARLIAPGAKIQEIAVVDFLRAEDGPHTARLKGRAYVVDAALAKFWLNNPLLLAQRMADKEPEADFDVLIHYVVDGQRWKRVSFEEAYGKAPVDEEKEPQAGYRAEDYLRVADQLPVDLESYRRVTPVPGNIVYDKSRRWFQLNLEKALALQSGGPGDEVCDKDDIGHLGLPQSDHQAGGQSHSHTLTGIFSSRWASDSSLHPGFGWRVVAWTQEFGGWTKLAEDWVQANGSWILQVPASFGYTGSHLRIQYRAWNAYFEPKNQAGDKYAWVDPDQNGIGTNFNAGHRFADTDGGNANGLGDLYDAGLEMWSKLYWNAGVDPVRSQPVNFWYPNTWNNCGGSSPWSCSAFNTPDIWLIPAHGIQANVTSHELAHQLQSEYWDNKDPSGAGGSHSLNSCYPSRLGMTMNEGFANFIPGWVGYQNRNVAPGGFNHWQWGLGYDLESRVSPPNCSNGWENEVWVARTFWDLHDTRADGDDILWFNHKGAVISLYLNNAIANDGDARDMRFYENIYRNAASAGHAGFITDIFEQNRH